MCKVFCFTHYFLERIMFEKDLRIAYLLDVYGDVLTERKAEVLDMYYNEDFSLSEIAEQIGISRQGVRDLIRKGQDELLFLEEKLGLAQKLSAMREHVDSLASLLRDSEHSEAALTELDALTALLK